jgi:hypothetical protein
MNIMEDDDLSLSALFDRADVCATTPLPPREEPDTRFFESATGDEVMCEHDDRGVRIESRGELVESGPPTGQRERLSIEELREIGERVELPAAFRPEWLDLQYAPLLRPFCWGAVGGHPAADLRADGDRLAVARRRTPGT